MSSKSSSNTSASTSQQDNRNVADNGSTALGAGASVVINDNFSSEVSNAFSELVNLAKTTIEGASDVLKSTTTQSLQQAQQQANANSDAVSAAYARAQAGDKSIYTDLFPIVAMVAVGVLVVVLIKKGK